MEDKRRGRKKEGQGRREGESKKGIRKDREWRWGGAWKEIDEENVSLTWWGSVNAGDGGEAAIGMQTVERATKVTFVNGSRDTMRVQLGRNDTVKVQPKPRIRNQTRNSKP